MLITNNSKLKRNWIFYYPSTGFICLYQIWYSPLQPWHSALLLCLATPAVLIAYKIFLIAHLSAKGLGWWADSETLQKHSQEVSCCLVSCPTLIYASPAKEATTPDSTLYKSGTDLYTEKGWAAKYGFL